MSLCTSTLLFCCIGPESRPLSDITGPIVLETDFARARADCEEKIFVVDAGAVSDDGVIAWETESPPRMYLPEVSPGQVLNGDPFAPVIGIEAAGGYLTRVRGGRVELLLIFRRGSWDLPKGKLDRGESVRDAALREVREELGITDVSIGRSLGTTIHGYPYAGRYAVKTTHWMEMTSGEEHFRPEIEEGIEKVEWVEAEEAVRRLDFPSLRRHTERILHQLEAA